jgi:hypothetical protein
MGVLFKKDFFDRFGARALGCILYRDLISSISGERENS